MSLTIVVLLLCICISNHLVYLKYIYNVYLKKEKKKCLSFVMKNMEYKQNHFPIAQPGLKRTIGEVPDKEESSLDLR